MSIYKEIASFAGDRLAIFVGEKSLARLALKSFQNSLYQATTNPVYSLAVAPYALRLDSVTTSGATPSVSCSFEKIERDIFLSLDKNLRFEFSFGVLEKDPIDSVIKFTDAIAKLEVLISHLRFELTATQSSISIAKGEAVITPAQPLRIPADLFEATVHRAGSDIDTATRIEGMLIYGGLASSIASTLASSYEININELFPSIKFEGNLDVQLSNDNKTLFLTGRSGLVRNDNCACCDVGNGIGSVTGTKVEDTNYPDIEDSVKSIKDTGGKLDIGTLNIGHPSSVNPKKLDLGRRKPGVGDTGLYMPLAESKKLFGGAYPAIRIDAEDNGFAGWKAVGIVDFDEPKITLDPAYGRVYVDLSFGTEIYGSLHTDLGKLGKIRVTSFSAEQSRPPANTARIGFYLVVGTNGVYLKPVLESVHIDGFKVDLGSIGSLVGSAWGGWGAVVGFIVQKILERAIGYQLPSKIDLAFREYMGGAMITLLNSNLALDLLGIRKDSSTALCEGDSSGLLVSCDYDG